mmetsp:Transcript_1431/g.4516  ORF Transcript_1431/g.4516 Transcript_1431/m.4516 type:complete len:205 (-) Transcript_1431:550-1164(-)
MTCAFSTDSMHPMRGRVSSSCAFHASFPALLSEEAWSALSATRSTGSSLATMSVPIASPTRMSRASCFCTSGRSAPCRPMMVPFLPAFFGTTVVMNRLSEATLSLLRVKVATRSASGPPASSSLLAADTVTLRTGCACCPRDVVAMGARLGSTFNMTVRASASQKVIKTVEARSTWSNVASWKGEAPDSTASNTLRNSSTSASP